MNLTVYDYRKDIRNILVTPQIRARFLRMEVGQVNHGHTHDLGQEIFLILQGQAEFDIDGRKAVLGPGQMCIALIDENHTVSNVGDEPVIMYLSVTPHIQPTHSSWDEQGTKLPHRFLAEGTYDEAVDAATPTDRLLDKHLAAVEELAARLEEAAQAQRSKAAALREAIAAGDNAGMAAARDEMWSPLCSMYAQAFEVAQGWNDLTARLASSNG